MNFNEKVYNIVKKIPSGKVATYGQIAFLCGSPRASRAVGRALHNNKNPDEVKCFRVVNRHGELAKSFVFGGDTVQKQLLLDDGIEVSSQNLVNLDIYLWDGKK